MNRETAVAALACAAVAFVYLWRLGAGLGNSDEVLYAEFIRAMHRTGDYFTLRYHEAVHLQRPAAPFALYALVARVVPGETGLRLLPAAFTAMAAVVVLGTARRASGRLDAGIAALAAFAGAPTVYCYGRALLSDPPFLLCLTIALAATIEAQRKPRAVVWAAAALGGAFAVKSVAAAIPALALAPWLWRAIRRHRGSPELRLGRAALAFLILALPFYVISLARFGRHFLDVHIGVNLLDRARGDLEGLGIGGPLAYVRHLWIFDGPIVTLVLGGAVVAAAILAWRERDETLGVCATFAMGCLVGLSFLGTRLPHYLLPFYPAAAICAGLLASRIAARVRQGVPLLVGALSLALLLRTMAYPTVDGFLAPSRSASALAAAFVLQGVAGPAYTLDWYAPAYAYYADRPWRLLAVDRRMARIVGAVDTFVDAHTVQAAPPWPSGRFVVAGPADHVYAAPGLRVVAGLASFEEGGEKDVLVVAEAASPVPTVK
jgi:4-amino-4-deoxy-L-arabinose transferase-like glycosyltransferase